MRGVRQHRRWGGLLALFALALQLVLSAGHLHVGVHAVSPALAATQAVDNPADHHDGHDERFCDLCAILHALGSAPLPLPPRVPLPPSAGRPHVEPPHLIAVAAFPAASFQPRAPPTA